MKLLADECCDALLVDGLRRDGHDVRYVTEFAPGEPDGSILQQAAAEERILVTEHKDFGELVVRLGLPAYGIVLLRMNPADSEVKLAQRNTASESQSPAASQSSACGAVSLTPSRPPCAHLTFLHCGPISFSQSISCPKLY